jgi:hypothetical protein
MQKRTNKRKMIDVIVASGNAALASGSLVTTGASLNIANGQIGVLAVDGDGTVAYGDFITAGITATQVNAVQIVQGTPASSNLNSADLFEVGPTALVKSGIINRDNIQSFTSIRYRVPNYSGTAFTSIATPKNNTEYKGYITLLSTRDDRNYGDNTNVRYFTFTTPNYTTLGTVSPLDHMLQNVAYRINNDSKYAVSAAGSNMKGNQPLIALAINSAGGSGLAIGTVTCGTTINFMRDTNTFSSTPVTSSIVADAALVVALANLVKSNATLVPASTIEVIDLTTAGSAANVDSLIVLGTSMAKGAYFDNIEQVMVTADVNLGMNFRTSGLVTTKVFPHEGLGQGWKWTIDNDGRAQLNVHTMQNQPYGEFFSEGYKYIDPLKNYTSYVIEYFDTEDILTLETKSPKQLNILVASTATCGTVTQGETNLNAGNPAIVTATTDSATVTSLNAILGVWLESARAYSQHELGGAAVAATYFV